MIATASASPGAGDELALAAIGALLQCCWSA